MLFLTVQSSWVRHICGVAALMQMSGPQICADRTSFEIFRSQRLLMTLSALVTGSSTFLASKKWKEMPWELQGLQKRHMDHLLDIVVDLPALNVNRPQQESLGYQYFGEHTKYLNSALGICDRLEEWKQHWEQSPQFLEMTTMGPPPGYPSAWDPPLSFSSPEASNCYSLYNATILCALDAARKFSTFSELPPRKLNELFCKRQQAAVEICRCIPYYLSVLTRALGELYLIWPLRMAWLTLRQSDREIVTWLKSQLDAVVTNHQIWDVAKETLAY